MDREFTPGGFERGPSHRPVYREFDTGGGRPDIGPQREGVRTTQHRIPVPGVLLKQAQILRDGPPAGTAPKPAAASQANVIRPPRPGSSKSKER